MTLKTLTSTAAADLTFQDISGTSQAAVGYANTSYASAPYLANYTFLAAFGPSTAGICLTSNFAVGCNMTMALGSSNTVFSGAVKIPQIIAGGSVPTIAPGAGAGTSPSCTSIAGANMAGVITCTTGSAPSPASTLATITFHGILGTAPQGCALMPRNAATALVVADEYTTAPTTTTWAIAVGATALAASTTYAWSYQCE
jgi:hypothetical protein